MRYLTILMLLILFGCAGPSMDQSLQSILDKHSEVELEYQLINEKDLWQIYYATQQHIDLEIRIPETPPTNITTDIYGYMVQGTDSDGEIIAYMIHKSGNIYDRDNFSESIKYLLE